MSKCKKYMCDKQIHSLQELEKKMGSTSFMDIPMTKWPEWYKCKYDMVPELLCQPHTSPELKTLKMNLTSLKNELKKNRAFIKEYYDSIRSETNKLKKIKDDPDYLKYMLDIIDSLKTDMKKEESNLIKKEGEFENLLRDIEKKNSSKLSPKLSPKSLPKSQRMKRCPNGERRNKKTKKCVKI